MIPPSLYSYAIFTATTFEMNYKQNSHRRSGSTPPFLSPKCDPSLLDSLEDPIKPDTGTTNTFWNNNCLDDVLVRWHMTFLHIFIPTAALRHQSNKPILRTSTIIAVMTTIMVAVLNIFLDGVENDDGG